MPAAPQANLSFLPWVRQGAAAAITTADTLGPKQAARCRRISITLNVNDTRRCRPSPVRLRGPADVVGIDAHQIVRTDPRPGTSDFESNCFPSIEFDRADFPVAVHAGARQRERAAAALAVPGRGAQARRRAAHEHGRRAAADAADRRAGQAVRSSCPI